VIRYRLGAFPTTLWRAAALLLLGWNLTFISAWGVPPGPVPSNDGSQPTFTFSQFALGRPLRFVAYGDSRFTDPSVTSGTNPRVRKWLAERVAHEHPEVLMLTGDTPYTGADAGDWRVFQQESASWRAQHILVLPSTGNHEVRGGASAGIANYLANFPQLGQHLYYSALLGSVEVISLDCTQGSFPSSAQARWFAAQLDHLPSQVEFLFILFHLPWMADKQSQIFVGLPTASALSLRNILEGRLGRIAAKVVVFNGHIHNYERFERRGVEYVVTGGGGAEPYPLLFRGRADLYSDLGFPVYHFVTIDVANHQLHAVMWKVKDPDAAELDVEAKDQFTITANPAKPAVKHRHRTHSR
jgi:hypothetical protein